MLVGGFISSARAAEAISLNAWVPASEIVEATAAVITTFRDYGHRGNRQKCRMMWLIEEMGIDKFRAEVASRMPSQSMACAAEDDLIDTSISRRSYLGVHEQRQEGLCWVVRLVDFFILLRLWTPFPVLFCFVIIDIRQRITLGLD
jgi:ferredoxin-nitrite reductase